MVSVEQLGSCDPQKEFSFFLLSLVLLTYFLPYFFSSFYFLSEAGRVQWYIAGLRFGRSGVQVLAGAGNFSLHHRIQTGSGAHPASYPMCTKGSFPENKVAGE
jgi:hypothetical protein